MITQYPVTLFQNGTKWKFVTIKMTLDTDNIQSHYFKMALNENLWPSPFFMSFQQYCNVIVTICDNIVTILWQYCNNIVTILILTRFRVKRPRFPLYNIFKRARFRPVTAIHVRTHAAALLILSSVARDCCSFMTPFICYNLNFILSCISSNGYAVMLILFLAAAWAPQQPCCFPSNPSMAKKRYVFMRNISRKWHTFSSRWT